MPKAAPSKQEEKQQVTEAAFLKSLNAHERAAAAAAKKERPSGILTDHQILELLELAPGDSGTFEAQVSKISFSFAKGDSKRPMYRFVYSIISDDPRKNGLIVTNNHILEAQPDKTKPGEFIRTYEEAVEQFFYELQGLGEDTASYKAPVLTAAHNATKIHTRDKTPVTLGIRHWVGNKVDPKTKKPNTGMNVRVLGVLADDDNSDLGDDAPEAAADDSSDSDDSGTDDAADAGDEFDGNAWVDIWIEFENAEYATEDDGKTVRAKVTAYNEEADTFDLVDANGEEWKDDFALKCDSEWQESATQE